MIRTCLFSLALAGVGCGQSSPDGQTSGKGAEKAAPDEKNDGPEKPTSDSDATKKADDPGATSGESGSDSATVRGDKADCGRIVNPADIKQACGVETEMKIASSEGKTPLATCFRKYRGPGGQSISFMLANHESAEKVSGLAWPAEVTPIADLGDAANAYVADKGGEFDWHTVEIRSGARVMYVRSIGDSGATPLCSTDKLTDLARETFARIK